MNPSFHSQPVSVAIKSWVDYLIAGRDEIIWFAAVEDDQHYEGPPSWTMPNADIVAYGRRAGIRPDQELVADAVKDLIAETLEVPLTRYGCFLPEGWQTVVEDPNLAGFFPVS